MVILSSYIILRKQKQYDVIICCGVLHHIPQYQEALAKMKQLLKPNGVLVLAVYNKYGKMLKKVFKIDYKSDILHKDQENNPFELSFTNKQVLDMCKDLQFKQSSPSIRNHLVDALAWTNSKNGGLVVYIFNKELA